ncbi:unnamed protein product [Rhizoctonia solani]|uniref:DRBM domain-containing protein n=1 Tax=Rhizoctonia solani TaxID=456999 RepID=A0A8H3CMY1_9AGAM|nr:unnamed protein product [Rhizoctonia solani]CAE6495917.1 unnamed protein product [Rhizoctonia solani]
MSTNFSVNPDDFVMKLNNLLQAKGKLNTLSWRETSSGPAHGPEWTISAYINNQEYGYGTHRTKQGARHQAARMALDQLALLDSIDEDDLQEFD